MGRRAWNVAELSELIAAFLEREHYFQEAISVRAQQKMGNESEEELLGPEYMRSVFVRQSVHTAQRLIEDDRTAPLSTLSEEEIRRVTTDMLQEIERRDETYVVPPEMRPILLNVMVQHVHRMFDPKSIPAASYETTWQWINMIDTWAVEQDQKPLAFFDQPDAYEQILRNTHSKETFLQEYWKRCDPGTNIESTKLFLIELLPSALIEDEHERETAKTQLLAEADKTLSTGISKGLQALYAEYVAEADRIYGPSEPALPA